MKSKLRLSLNRSLATQLLRIVFGFYLVVVVCSMLGQMLVEYRYQKNSIRREFSNIQTTFEHVLAGEIWHLDEKALSSTVEGMIELPVIVGMKICDENGKIIAIGGIVKNGNGSGETGIHVRLSGCAPADEKTHSGEAYRLEMFEGGFPIIYTVNNERRVLGRATIYSNTSVILNRIKMSFLMLGIVTMVQVGLLWLIFKRVFVRVLKKPLSELTNAVERVTLDNLDSIKVSARSSGHDELGALTESFNQMLRNLRSEITKRTIADQRLAASEAKLNGILRVAPAGIGLIKGRVFLSVNPALCELTGYRSEELLGRRTRFLYPTEEAYLRGGDRLFALIVQRGMGTTEVSWRRKDGRCVDVLLSAATLTPNDPDGDITFIAMDITDRKLAEEREKTLRTKLEQATRMESLGVLAGGVAHDLNNVLGPILILPDLVAGYIKRCGKPADPEREKTLESLKMIKTSALRAAAMVDDLVVMGRRGQFQSAPVDVNEVVKQTLNSKQIQTIPVLRPNVKLSKQLSADPLWCQGSDLRLVRVLANLVSNAAEAITGQGDITVRTGRQVLTELRHGYEDVPAGDYITVEVEDTGCGMDAKTMALIFEPFYSTKAPGERSGSGLGLSVVNGLVKDHAGFLDVRSAPDKGTTFTIYLPSVPADDVAVVPKSDPRSGGNERVLVVDDEPSQRFLTQLVLKDLGYDAAVVSSGEDAVELFESAGKSAPFDLIMMDLIMKGMNGLAASKAILKMFPKQRILIVSGYVPDELVAEIEALGLGRLHKPYEAPDLARIIRATLNR